MDKSFETLNRLWKVLKVVLIFSLIVLTWLASFDLAVYGLAALPKTGGPIDLATILSGAGTIALFIFSMFIAIVAIVGWQTVEGKIREAVEAGTNKRLENTENESRGRSFAILGYVIGENSVVPDFSAPSNEERLREAIYYCEQAYERLKNSGLPVEFMALNNLLTYSCALGDKSRRGYILECARRLREAAQEHDAPNLLLTYANTILAFELDPKEIREACSIVTDVKLNPRLNAKQQREADHLASLCATKTMS